MYTFVYVNARPCRMKEESALFAESRNGSNIVLLPPDQELSS
jgi:hypothetical protein